MKTTQTVNYDNLIFCYLDKDGNYITEQDNKKIEYLKIYELPSKYVSNSGNGISIAENNRQQHTIKEIKEADLSKQDKKKLTDRTNELIEKITKFFNLQGDRDENKFEEYRNYLKEKNNSEKEEESKLQKEKENNEQKNNTNKKEEKEGGVEEEKKKEENNKENNKVEKKEEESNNNKKEKTNKTQLERKNALRIQECWLARQSLGLKILLNVATLGLINLNRLSCCNEDSVNVK